MFGNDPWRRRPPLWFMLLVGEMCVFVGLADFMTEFSAHAVSAEGTLAGASLISVGAAWLLWGWSGGR
jgi:hypothetical protein